MWFWGDCSLGAAADAPDVYLRFTQSHSLKTNKNSVKPELSDSRVFPPGGQRGERTWEDSPLCSP